MHEFWTLCLNQEMGLDNADPSQSWISSYWMEPILDQYFHKLLFNLLELRVFHPIGTSGSWLLCILVSIIVNILQEYAMKLMIQNTGILWKLFWIQDPFCQEGYKTQWLWINYSQMHSNPQFIKFFNSNQFVDFLKTISIPRLLL